MAVSKFHRELAILRRQTQRISYRFFLAVFLAAVFLAVFLAAVFLAVFLAAAFLAVFFVTVFLAVSFFAADFFLVATDSHLHFVIVFSTSMALRRRNLYSIRKRLASFFAMELTF